MRCVVSSRDITYPSPKTIPPKSATSFKAILHPFTRSISSLKRFSYVFHKCCSEAPSLISDLGWIHIIEYGQNYGVSSPLTFHDHNKFIEAPSRPSIVYGEHDYRYFLLLYCLISNSILCPL